MTKRKAKDIKAHVIQIAEPEQKQLPVVNTPDVLLKIGIEKGLSIDQLEKLMAMQKEWWDRQAESLYLEAKTKFQSKVPVIKKVKPVDQNKNRDPNKPKAAEFSYAPLGEIATVVNPILGEFGLSYDWEIEDFYDDQKAPKIRVTCVVSHVGGHKKRTKMEAYHESSGNKTGIHSRASTVSYLERYTLKAALGVVEEDEDDDGSNAQDNTKVEVKKEKISDGQFRSFWREQRTARWYWKKPRKCSS